MPELTANGVGTYYEESGDGPAVVLVHGLGSSTALWDGIVPALATRFRTVRYDLRGSGLSERPPGPYLLTDLVADLDGVIDALGLAPAALVGHSLSGGLVLAYAAHHPGKVRAVVGVGAVTELPDAGRDGMRQRAATVRAEGMENVAATVATNGVAPSWRETSPEAWDAFRAGLAANDPEGYALQAEVVAAIDVRADLGRIACPVLLVSGDLDAPSPPALNEENSERVQNGRHALIVDTGHIVPLERPDELLGAMLRFL